MRGKWECAASILLCSEILDLLSSTWVNGGYEALWVALNLISGCYTVVTTTFLANLHNKIANHWIRI